MVLHKQVVQITIIAVCGAVTIAILSWWFSGFSVSSILSAVLITFILIFTQSFYWWVFVNYLSRAPVWLYPIMTFLLTGMIVYSLGSLIPGVEIYSIRTSIWISFWFTVSSAVVSSLLSLDIDEQFDRNVTSKLVARRGNPIKTDVPGFVFLEVDGLSEKLFRKALDEGYMPTLKSWIDRGTHRITPWETDFSSQTGSMQPGILLGNNEGIPAYRWWDRTQGKMIMSGDPRALQVLEKQLSNGKGLLSGGGASRGNMYSGDASESLLTFSTLLNNANGETPGFYTYLISPFILARLFTNFFTDVFREWWQAFQQRRRKDKYRISARNWAYAFFRAFMGPFMQDVTTYTVISDIVRGVPAIYALYAGYDDVAHFAGMQTKDAFGVLHETDRYFARVEKALEYAPRPYHLIILSDHGQSEGPTFKAAYGTDLEGLVKALVKQEGAVFAELNTNENWNSLNVFLTESINANTRSASVMRTALRSKTKSDGVVQVGQDQNSEELKAQESNIIVFGSGSTGLISFRDAKKRLTYEEIQERYPELILGLAKHPGIGWVLVRSKENGDMIIGNKGIYYIDKDEIEGENPIASYGPNALYFLKRETSFEHCPDILVNTKYDPVTEELCGFENQVSHHGGLGGPQNHAFIMHPVTLPEPKQPILGAEKVYAVLRGWRDTYPSKS